MSLWFSIDVKMTNRGIVITGENITGTRTVDVLLTSDIVDKLMELISHDRGESRRLDERPSEA